MAHGIASAQNLERIQPEPVGFIFYINISYPQFPGGFLKTGQRRFLIDRKTLMVSFDLFFHRLAEKGQICFLCSMVQSDHGKFLFHMTTPFC